MATLSTALREEVGTVAKKELRRQTASSDKALARCECDLAALKGQVQGLRRALSSLPPPSPGSSGARKKSRQVASPQPASKVSAPSAGPLPRGQLSSEALKAHRERLGLSAERYGKLIGVSGLTIYHWERGQDPSTQEQHRRMDGSAKARQARGRETARAPRCAGDAVGLDAGPGRDVVAGHRSRQQHHALGARGVRRRPGRLNLLSAPVYGPLSPSPFDILRWEKAPNPERTPSP